MKRVLLYIGIAIAAMGCTKSEITDTTSFGEEINFSAGVTTRVATNNDCAWKDDDQIGIFTDQAYEENLLFEISNDITGEMTNESSQKLMSLDSGERTYYAYHPYSKDQDNEPKMSIDLTEGYSTPLLWATDTSNETEVKLTFTHMLPKITFKLTADGEDVKSLSGATAILKGAYNSADFYIAHFDDFNGGEFYSCKANSDITLTVVEELGEHSITAYLIPMEDVSSNVNLYITAGGDTYIYPITTSEWKSTWKYEYEIIVGEKNND